jgi:hypothetical protein
LHSDFTFDSSEALYFLLASTTVLERLEMNFPVDIDFVKRFVEALRVNRTLTELRVPICFFEEKAIESLFVTYMQTRNGVGTSCIQTLSVFGFGETSRHWLAVAHLLKGPHGSGIKSIRLGQLHQGHGLWAGLAVHEQSRNLHCVEVVLYNGDEDDDLEFAAMLRHLPNMLYLRKLHCYWYRDNDDLWKCMWAVRTNGSLHVVKPCEQIAKGSIWDGQPSRLLQAWGQRNLELPNVMRPCDEDDDDVGARKVARECKADKCPSRSRRATNVALLPSLLLVARQTPRMAPNHKFSGLLAFSEYIGPNSQNS